MSNNNNFSILDLSDSNLRDFYARGLCNSPIAKDIIHLNYSYRKSIQKERITLLDNYDSLQYSLKSLNLSYQKLSSLKCIQFYQLEMLNLRDNIIKKIDYIGSTLLYIKTLNLSNNKIDSYESNIFKNFKHLESLKLANNNLSSLNFIHELSSCCNLRSLTLYGNPLSNLDHYRLYIIYYLPQLSSLDNKEITDVERNNAELQFRARGTAENLEYQLITIQDDYETKIEILQQKYNDVHQKFIQITKAYALIMNDNNELKKNIQKMTTINQNVIKDHNHQFNTMKKTLLIQNEEIKKVYDVKMDQINKENFVLKDQINELNQQYKMEINDLNSKLIQEQQMIMKLKQQNDKLLQINEQLKQLNHQKIHQTDQLKEIQYKKILKMKDDEYQKIIQVKDQQYQQSKQDVNDLQHQLTIENVSYHQLKEKFEQLQLAYDEQAQKRKIEQQAQEEAQQRKKEQQAQEEAQKEQQQLKRTTQAEEGTKS